MKKLKDTITNQQIDHYRLTRHYGDGHYTQALRDLSNGTIRSTHILRAVERGDYGSEAQAALASRPRRRKRTPSELFSPEELTLIQQMKAKYTSKL